MQAVLGPSDFIAQLNTGCVMLDVRSPGEYEQGHIPGALSFPLFTDEERARVGKMYKQTGKEEAMELGLRIVGPKMADFVKTAKKLAPERRLAVHCWRGGQRSGSMAWLFRQSGFEVVTLGGGYKAYRQHVLEHFGLFNPRIVVVGGKTGSGKTKVLHALRDLGEQIIDLEGIAHHKGSAFGFIGEMPQPTVEQFENDLFAAITQLDHSKRIWIENESKSIGRVFIPLNFWAKMKAAPLVNIEIPFEDRLQNLLDDYVQTDPAELQLAFNKIASKLGGLNLKLASEALDNGNYTEAAKIALSYYDKTYQHNLDVNVSPDIRNASFEQGDPAKIALALTQIQGL
ncbi:MAG: tRNA 2-selenouridine(34) synthase MnmH [Chitinophagales bacterium]|nr:tRNA 2-selenouridine(34) synthase MnmH [Chitinophagales bacterium]